MLIPLMILLIPVSTFIVLCLATVYLDDVFSFIEDFVKKLLNVLVKILISFKRKIRPKPWDKSLLLIEKSLNLSLSSRYGITRELDNMLKKYKREIKSYQGFLSNNEESFVVLHQALKEAKSLGLAGDDDIKEKIVELVTYLKDKAELERGKQIVSLRRRVEIELDILNKLDNINK